ncbi:MAG: class I SAM-dependent methyltransferase [Sandaracinaceae bacterium]|nr:class I SAM-dependent methyltransferase [Sandaracinaceae bacterium]
MAHDEALAANRARWDELVAVHAASRFYDVPAFLAGRCTLLPIERAALGDVSGKRLLHLQCHFGLDTLSWARRGAIATGLDFSGEAVGAARELAVRAAIDARFVESEVTRAPEALDGERFDIVFTSWGVLGWLPDLDAWARAVAGTLAPGGVFHCVETHPTAWLFDGSPLAAARTYDYFRADEPIVDTSAGTYADRGAELVAVTRYSWIYELGQVVNALLDAGLVLERLEEHDGTCSEMIPGLVRGDDGLWRLPPGQLSLPLSFSLRARRPA